MCRVGLTLYWGVLPLARKRSQEIGWISQNLTYHIFTDFLSQSPSSLIQPGIVCSDSSFPWRGQNEHFSTGTLALSHLTEVT